MVHLFLKMSFMINFTLNIVFNSCFFTGLVHKSNWQQLRLESCALREKGLAQGTWANKISHLRSYLAFTTYFEVQDFPVLLDVLLRFIAFLGRGSHAYKSATNLLGSIKWFNSLLDPSPTNVFDAVWVTASLKGLKAQLSRPIRQKLPLNVNHLVKFFDMLDLENIKHLACWCAMLLAFFGCFRLSNLVPTSCKKFDPLKQLRRNDISFDKNIVLVYYKWSKTNQNAKKVAWIPICPVSDNRFNVKFYLKKLFKCVKAPGDAPLFAYSKSQCHSRYTLTRFLDKCVFEAGLSPSDYSWHSFRRGAAVFAFEAGLADSAVQLLGDWSSSAFTHYLEFAFLRKVSVAETIADKFDDHVRNC